MKLVLRLLGAIWVSSLVIIAGFAFLQITLTQEEHEFLRETLRR